MAVKAQKWELDESLQRCLAVSPAITYTLTVKGGTVRPVWVSENIRQILGYTPEEALPPGWWAEHLHPPAG